MKKTITMVLLFAIGVQGYLYSDEHQNQSTEMERRFFQISFFYPLGTGYTKSMEYTNNISLNLLVGLNGGVRGVEIGGLVNYIHKDVKGVSLAGLGNIIRGNVRGALISGLVNYAGHNMTGFQMGLFNYAGTLTGAQVGLINVVTKDAKNAIPFGLINIIKNGYYAFELNGAGGSLRFKMGTEHFYTILSAGVPYSTLGDSMKYEIGGGFGSMLSFSKNHAVVIDLMSNGVYDFSNLAEIRTTQYLTLGLKYQYSFNKHFALFLGPSFNYMYLTNSDERILPYFYVNYFDKDENHGYWVGAEAGITFRF